MILRTIRSLSFEPFVSFEFSSGVFSLNFISAQKYNFSSVYVDLLRSLSASAAIAKICQAIVGGRSFSMIRVGHCEVKFIAHGYLYGASDLKSTCQIQWGVDEIAPEYFQFVRLGLLDAVKKSDFVGFNTPGALSAAPLKILENSVSKSLVDFSLLSGVQCRVRPNIHWDLALSSEFLQALNSAKKIVLVTPRTQLESVFKKIYNGIDIELLCVQGEHKVDGASDLDARFQIFKKVDDRIKEISAPGVVFLIGAGVAGKRFISSALLNNGIALDLGSALDAWAGVDSRGDGFKGRFKHFIDGFSLS